MKVKVLFDDVLKWESEDITTQPVPPEPVFTCSKCGATFTSQALLDNHVASAHPVPPPTGSWLPIAFEWGVFTLTQAKTVRYGKGDKWAQKDLPPGNYQCSNMAFGDPAPGVPKVCEVWTGTSPSPDPSYDPMIPTLRYLLPPNRVHFGTSFSMFRGEKEFYINLPAELPAIDSSTVRRPALPLGQNYGDLEVVVVNLSQIGTLWATITDPKGTVHDLNRTENTLSFRFQNQTPAYPGRYLLRVTAALSENASTNVQITWGAKPSPLEPELGA